MNLTPHRIVASAKSSIAVESFELPEVGPTQVLIETHYSAISPGTELAFLHNKPNTPGNYPFYPGYSACGQVIKTGEAVDSLTIGQIVVSSARHASHAVLEAAQCQPLPDTLSEVDASPFRLVSIALQGIRKAQIQLGWEVAVIGLGPIGSLAGQLSRATGATYVEGIDPVGWRRELALACGFDAVAASTDQTGRQSTGFDVVIDATGVPQAIPPAFQLAKRLGHVLLLASTRGETSSVNFYRDVHKKGLTVVGAHDSIRPAVDDHLFYQSHQSDVSTSLKLIASGRVQTAPLISDIVSPEEADRAYERLTARDEALMLIVFRWK